MLRSLFLDDDRRWNDAGLDDFHSSPTIQLVGPEVLFLDLAASGQDCNGDGPRGAPGRASLPLITPGGVTRKEMAEQSVKEGAPGFCFEGRSPTCEAGAGAAERAGAKHSSGTRGFAKRHTTGLYNGEEFRALTAKAVQGAREDRRAVVVLRFESRTWKRWRKSSSIGRRERNQGYGEM